MSTELDAHLNLLTRALVSGRVVPFFGAGVNLTGRSEEAAWTPAQRELLPSGVELAQHLASWCDYPEKDHWNLARVSQYAVMTQGSGPLFEELHGLFNADFPPTVLHHFFATLRPRLQAKGYLRSDDPLRRQPLLVTTNYDDLLERAFLAAGEPFHLVAYVAEGSNRGKFTHTAPGGKSRLIERPNDYTGLLDDHSPVVLKIHGAVDRADFEGDSYVITEDHYIDYLTRTDLSNLLPVPLPARLTKSHLLFLGYGLRDWNLRVILYRIWGDRKLSYKSWAVQLAPGEIDSEYWRQRDVDILDMRLGQYISALDERVETLATLEAAPV